MAAQKHHTELPITKINLATDIADIKHQNNSQKSIHKIDKAAPKIVLATLNARYFHTSFGLRYLYANLQELQEFCETGVYYSNSCH